ncbi:MAG: peptidoglycan-binding domain-containing protein [Pseudomonadota bacterium]
MSAVRARVLLGAFVALFVGVAINAMALQESAPPWYADTTLDADALDSDAQVAKPAAQPTRRRVRRVLPQWNPTVTASITEEETAETVEDAETGPAVPRPIAVTHAGAREGSVISVTATTSASKETVRAIQRELSARGYEPGPVDGIAGVMTRAAVMAFEHDERLTLTADPSEALLEQIILGGIGASARASQQPPSAISRQLAKSVQQALARLGYGPGPADGIVSRNTAKAIRKFETDHSLAPTGRISGRLVSEIARVSGARFSIAAGW